MISHYADIIIILILRIFDCLKIITNKTKYRIKINYNYNSMQLIANKTIYDICFNVIIHVKITVFSLYKNLINAGQRFDIIAISKEHPYRKSQKRTGEFLFEVEV